MIGRRGVEAVDGEGYGGAGGKWRRDYVAEGNNSEGSRTGALDCGVHALNKSRSTADWLPQTMEVVIGSSLVESSS